MSGVCEMNELVLERAEGGAADQESGRVARRDGRWRSAASAQQHGPLQLRLERQSSEVVEIAAPGLALDQQARSSRQSTNQHQFTVKPALH